MNFSALSPQNGAPPNRFNLLGALCLLLLASLQPLSGQSMIVVLQKTDPNFKELLADIEENSRRMALGKELLPLRIYRYQPKTGETLFTIAAKLLLRYDSIVSLNSIASPLLFESAETIFLPNLNGLAIETASNDLFFNDLSTRLKANFALEEFFFDGEKERELRFYPGARFSQQERKIFLTGFFLSPLTGNLVATSGFGVRSDPFGSGTTHHHNGIDLRAAIGTPVYAARFGKVTAIKSDNILGLYVMLDHEAGYQSIYGHLSDVLVKVGDTVKTNQKIALSGNTGNSTGPHLHFELRKDGVPINPISLLNTGTITFLQ